MEKRIIDEIVKAVKKELLGGTLVEKKGGSFVETKKVRKRGGIIIGGRKKPKLKTRRGKKKLEGGVLYGAGYKEMIKYYKEKRKEKRAELKKLYKEKIKKDPNFQRANKYLSVAQKELSKLRKEWSNLPKTKQKEKIKKYRSDMMKDYHQIKKGLL